MKVSFILEKIPHPFKKIASVFLKLIGSGTSLSYPDYYNARLRGINCLLLLSTFVQLIGLGLISLRYPVTTEQYTQTFITVLINFLLLYLHYKQRFKLSEFIFSSAILVSILAVQILYIVTPFSMVIFVLAASIWHYNYVDNPHKTGLFTLLLFILSLSVYYGIHANVIQPYIAPKSEVFNGNFASFLALLFGVAFFVVNARIYKNEIIRKEEKNNKTLLIKRNKKVIQLSEEEILFLKADRNYVEIHTTDGKQWAEKSSLSNFSKKLSPMDFIQIHKSYWINKNHIGEFSKKEVVINEYSLPVGRKFYDSYVFQEN